MRATRGIGTVLTSRDVLLVRTLATARVLDGEQMRTVGKFTSVRRTNRRLLKLVRAGVLRRWFVGTASGGQKALYGLSPQGATLIGETTRGLIPWKQDALITTSQFLDHQQAVNAVFILARFEPLPDGFSCPRWLNFREPLAPSVPLIPDGYFEIVRGNEVYPMFLEADRGTESSTVWKRKVELYLKLALGGEFERMFEGKRFRVLLVLPSLRRLEAVRRIVLKRTEKLFWFATQGKLEREGLCAPVWLRPKGTERIALL
jgi:protein involved in plasmid replication-relaxation